MAVGWGAMSGAAINIILAPWFQRRRGLAVSLAFNGATLGGVIVTPALIALAGLLGFSRALTLAALALFAVLLVLAAAVMCSGPDALELGPDGGPPRAARAEAPEGAPRGWRRAALRTWRFWSVSAPFALDLAAKADNHQSAREARSAPSTSARSLCHTMFVSTWTLPAKVPNPQSTPAMTFSRPTTEA
jgi:MFS family permease